MEIAGRQVGAVGGVMENFPLEKSQSSTAGNNGTATSVPLSLGHALYKWTKNVLVVTKFLKHSCCV